MPNPENPAEMLRRAATLMRERAEREVTPTVAIAVADWLDDTCPLLACDNCTSSEARCRTAQANGAIACCPECAHGKRALAVARAYLGDSHA